MIKNMVKGNIFGLMVTSMKVISKMTNQMVKELTLSPLEHSMLGIGKMEKKMVKEYGLQLLEIYILGNGRMVRNMVKGNSIKLMEMFKNNDDQATEKLKDYLKHKKKIRLSVEEKDNEPPLSIFSL